MSSSYQAQGTIVQIGETVNHSEKFSSREIVLLSEVRDFKTGDIAGDHIVLKVYNGRTSVLDQLSVGMFVDVRFSISASKSEKNGQVKYWPNLILDQVSILFDPNDDRLVDVDLEPVNFVE